MEASMSGKWVELLKEIAPSVTRVAILFNPTTAPRGGSYYFGPFKAAVQSLGLETIAATVPDKSEIESVIAAQAREGTPKVTHLIASEEAAEEPGASPSAKPPHG
jgi:putative ABC transport system substrate-binding protein